MGERDVKLPAVFLDRDGVLNHAVVRDGVPFPPASLAEFEVAPDAADECARLKAAGFVLVVVTNQPDVGRGTQTRAVVEAMHQELRRRIPALDGIEVCYHAGERHGEPCACRKPKPGLLFRAASTHGIDLARSFLVGDRWRDVDCADAAGCCSIFIDRAYREPLRAQPDFIVATLSEATATILKVAARNGLAKPSARH